MLDKSSSSQPEPADEASVDTELRFRDVGAPPPQPPLTGEPGLPTPPFTIEQIISPLLDCGEYRPFVAATLLLSTYMGGESSAVAVLLLLAVAAAVKSAVGRQLVLSVISSTLIKSVVMVVGSS